MNRTAADVARQIEKAVQHLNGLLVEASGENDVTMILSIQGGIRFDPDHPGRTNTKPYAEEPLRVSIDFMAIE